MIPKKGSRGWLPFWLAIVAINFTAFAASRWILGVAAGVRALAYFFVFSAALALVIAAPGYFGQRVYAVVFSAANAVAAAYLVLASAVGPGGGWAGLTSIAGYMALCAVGLLLGVAAQAAITFTKCFRRKGAGKTDTRV